MLNQIAVSGVCCPTQGARTSKGKFFCRKSLPIITTWHDFQNQSIIVYCVVINRLDKKYLLVQSELRSHLLLPTRQFPIFSRLSPSKKGFRKGLSCQHVYCRFLLLRMKRPTFFSSPDNPKLSKTVVGVLKCSPCPFTQNLSTYPDVVQISSTFQSPEQVGKNSKVGKKKPVRAPI